MEPYDAYNYIKFYIPIGINGDSYDRYLIRLEEMRESSYIILQALDILHVLNNINDNNYIINDFKIAPPYRALMKFNMESLIHHFKLYSEGFNVIKELTFNAIEAPKGELSILLISNYTNKPYRCRIKSPGFLHLQGLNYMSKNLYLADLVAIIGTQDLVFGEIDR
jgi:NADH:ubiquinone oxidoreductase subunit D